MEYHMNFSTKMRKLWQNSYGIPYEFFNKNEEILTKFLRCTIWIFQRKWENFDKIPMGYHMNFSTKIRKLWQNSHGVPYEFFNENEKFLTKFQWGTIWIFQRKIRKIWQNSYGVPYGFFKENQKILTKFIWGTIWIFQRTIRNFWQNSYEVPYEFSLWI